MGAGQHELRYDIGGGFAVALCDGEGPGLAERLRDAIGGRRALLCTTPTVARLYADMLARLSSALAGPSELVVLRVGETDKHIESVIGLCAQAQRFGIGRRDVMVAIGGGVCSDIVRVASGLIRRGIPHICVPTTLIGQIDAGIGIKGGVNFNGAKSYLGVFHAPEAAMVDPRFLATLPLPAWRDGIAEAIKLACIADAGLFARIEAMGPTLPSPEEQSNGDCTALVRRSIEITLAELALDPLERGTLCRLLDFGHSFSPAIETASEHRISHGQAVGIDMCVSAEIAVALGRLADAEAGRIVAAIAGAGLPADCAELTPALMRRSIDAVVKHRAGKANLVIPVAVGACDFIREAATLSDAVMGEALAALRRRSAGLAQAQTRYEARS